MNSFDDALWTSLETMRIAPAEAALSFEARLAREQRWGAAYTLRVMREYRRFLYLAATAERPVTPSEDVDAAWHLHLIYSRHYWDELCGRILSRPLHHDPTEGGPAQQTHFVDQYAATLGRYEAVFGQPPPAAVWPSPEDRFASPAPRRWPGLFAAGAASLAVAGCTALTGATGGGVIAMVLGGGLLILLLGFIGVAAARHQNRDRKHDGSGDGGTIASGCSSSKNADTDGGSDGGGSSGCGGSGCGGGGCGGS